MTTTETNKLIAEFMGYPKVANDEDKRDYLEDCVKYHTSWDWLMPVVRKIVKICCNENEDAFASDEYTSILETIPLARIEDSYKVVVEFIKWYNQNKKKL